MPALNVEGGRMVYTTAGSSDAPPLILVHGWTSYRGVWQQTIEAFQNSHYCLAVDLMGFGDSDKLAAADYNIAAQGRRILTLADALGLEKFTLIGHSMGGQIVTLLAAALAPERVTRLVSVAGVVTGQLNSFVRYYIYPASAVGARFPMLYALVRPLIHQPWYACLNFRCWFYRMDTLPFEMWAEDRRRAVQPGSHVANFRAGQAVFQADLTAYLSQVKAPALVIHGTQDGTVPVSDACVFQKHVPNSDIILLEECGHFPMYEKPHEYLRALRAFLCA